MKRLLRRWRSLPERLRAAVVIGVVVVAFTSPSWATGKLSSAADILQAWTPFKTTEDYAAQNTLLSDVAVVFEPWLSLLKDAVKERELPLWNQYQGFGTPHLANGQSALFYAPTWAVPLLGYRLGLLVLHGSKLFLLGFFTYLFLRELKLRHGASLIGGLAFAFSGFNVGWLYWPLPAVTASLPLMLLGVARATNRPRAWSGYVYLLLGVALGIAAGHPETYTHVLVVVGAYGLYKIVTHGRGMRASWLLLLRLAGAGLVGLALAAVQLLPTTEYVLSSHSLAVPNRDQTFNIPREYAVLNVLPDLFGNQTFPESVHGGYHGNIGTNYNEVTGGAAGLAVALLAVLCVSYFWRTSEVRFFAGLSLLVAGVVYRVPLIYEAFSSLPLLKQSYNERFSFAIAFGLCVLAAYLVSKVSEGAVDLRQKRTFATIGIFFAVVLLGAVVAVDRALLIFDVPGAAVPTRGGLVPYLAHYVPVLAVYSIVLIAALYWAGRRTLPIAVAGFVLVELVAHGMNYEPAIDRALHFPRTPTVQFLQDNLGNQRFIGLADAGSFPPDIATYYRIRDFRNYDGALLEDYVQTVESHGHAPGNWMIVVRMEPKFLSAGAVRYLISSNDEQLATTLGLTPEQAERYRVAFVGPGLNIYENPDVWSRAYWQPSAAFFAGASATQAPPAADVLEETFNSVTVRIEAPADGYLILSDSYTNGWAATVDGTPAVVERADLNFRAVRVGEGVHTVRFSYVPRSFYIGATISGATVAGLFVLGIWRWRVARRRRLAATPA